MSHSVRISPAVKQELADAFEWYQSKNVKAAQAFRSEVLAAFELLSRDPLRWTLWGDEIRRYVLKQYPYTVYFKVVDEEVRILAVGHHRRKAGYWRGRTFDADVSS